MSIKLLSRGDVALVAASTVIIIFAIAIAAALQGSSANSFSQVITVGPIWNTDSWTCTSNDDFMVFGSLRALGTGNQIAIAITGVGTQSLYELDSGQLETFSVGAPADNTIIITRTGTITGFITMQTTSDASAGCTST